MASQDLITVYPVTANGQGKGIAVAQSVGSILTGAPATAAVGGSVKQAAFIAQTTVPFASLTTAAQAYNQLLTNMIAAGQMAAS
jgi:hypothetical protein